MDPPSVRSPATDPPPQWLPATDPPSPVVAGDGFATPTVVGDGICPPHSGQLGIRLPTVASWGSAFPRWPAGDPPSQGRPWGSALPAVARDRIRALSLLMMVGPAGSMCLCRPPPRPPLPLAPTREAAVSASSAGGGGEKR
uniref:Uncharacterized protein n=1 Tax=Oryza punctata TaxID=4537 RepID=A0A0E0LYK5_ORYPU